jgi:hypothetical protein
VRADAIVLRLFGSLEVIHAARLRCVAKVVAGLLCAAKTQLTFIGRRLPGRAKPKHAIKSVDRLLGNEHLLREAEQFQRVFVGQLPRDERPILLIDWTDIGKHWAALVVALAHEGRGLILTWEVHPRRQENNPRIESSLLRKLSALLPAGCKPILVTDAGFRGPWLRKVRESGWDFVARVRGRVKVRAADSTQWMSVKALWCDAKRQARDLGEHELARYLPVHARLVAVWKNKPSRARPEPKVGRRKKRNIRSAREPWILATSIRDAEPKSVVDVYAARMRIELTFRDQKCPRLGLGLDLVRTKQLKRVEAYLLLSAIAHYVLMAVGAAAEEARLAPAFQANTINTRRVLSLARLGREVLARWMLVASDTAAPALLNDLRLNQLRGDP